MKYPLSGLAFMEISLPLKFARIIVPGYTMSGDLGFVKFTRPVYTIYLLSAGTNVYAAAVATAINAVASIIVFTLIASLAGFKR